MANPVQPSSSKNPPISPATTLDNTRDALASVVKIGELIESAKSTAAAKIGPVRSKPATLGPASIARTTNVVSVSNWLPVPGKPPGPTTKTKPPQEMANVRAK